MSARTHLPLFSAAIILAACATAQENPHYQYSTKYKGAAPSTSHAANVSTSTVSGTTVSGQSVTRQSYSAANAPAGTVLARYVHEDPNQPLGDVQGSTAFVGQTISQPAPQRSSYAAASYETTTYSAPSYSRVDAACISQGAQGSAACTPTSLPIGRQSASIASPYLGNPETLYVTNKTITSAAATAISPTEQAMPDSYGTPGYEAMKNAETDWDAARAATPNWEPVEAAPQQSAETALGVAVPMTEPFASPLPAPSVRQALSPDMMPRNEQSFTLGSQHVIAEGDTVYSFARNLCSSVDEIKTLNGLDGSFNIRLGDTIRLPASKC